MSKVKKNGHLEFFIYFLVQPKSGVQCYPKLKLETEQQCPRTQGTTITETSGYVTEMPGDGEVLNDLYASNSKKNSLIRTGLSVNSIDTCKYFLGVLTLIVFKIRKFLHGLNKKW